VSVVTACLAAWEIYARRLVHVTTVKGVLRVLRGCCRCTCTCPWSARTAVYVSREEPCRAPAYAWHRDIQNTSARIKWLCSLYLPVILSLPISPNPSVRRF
jgi:hypothetical protein